jgi:SAM-dependent methyltransferase
MSSSSSVERGYIKGHRARSTPGTRAPIRKSAARPSKRTPVRRLANSPEAAPARFRYLDAYRANREWLRYEGTAQRELFRSLRQRFLERHAVADGRTLDLGCGPGRFTPQVGGPGCRRVGIDLSDSMLREVGEHWELGTPFPDLVRADGLAPPFRASTFSEVALLGNAVGFAGPAALTLLASCASLVAAGGSLVVELAPGTPSESRYLHRLPPGAVVRLLRAPTALVRGRVEREGFRWTEGPDRKRHGFRPLSEEEVSTALKAAGFDVGEVMAVAPALGGNPELLEVIGADRAAFSRLLDLEESLGRAVSLRQNAAALLLVAVRRSAAGAQGIM